MTDRIQVLRWQTKGAAPAVVASAPIEHAVWVEREGLFDALTAAAAAPGASIAGLLTDHRDGRHEPRRFTPEAEEERHDKVVEGD